TRRNSLSALLSTPPRTPVPLRPPPMGRPADNPTPLVRGRFSNRLFSGLHRARPDNLPRWLCLEHCRLFGEGIDALTLLGSRFLDDDELGESRKHEHACLFQFLVANGHERFHHALNVLLR